ncbi:MAG: endonuclease domain-containing protein [Rickettsiales bacterium]
MNRSETPRREFAEPTDIALARKLRTHSTEVEKKLWWRIRNRELDGYKFRRQFPVAGYILDFACEAEKLAIELDGGQHNMPENIARDTARTAELTKSGWRVLRFWNNEVNENIEGVLTEIRHALTRTLSK